MVSMKATEEGATSEPKGDGKAKGPGWRPHPCSWRVTVAPPDIAAKLQPGGSPRPDTSSKTKRTWLCPASLGADVPVIC